MNEINKNTLKHKWLTIAKNFKFLPDQTYLNILYECYTDEKLNLENPQTFNEKIQWYKLFYRNPLFTKLVDKYKVREFVKERIGEEFLIPLLGVYDHPDEIDFKNLPDQFVIKGNHGCRFNLIVRDKEKLKIGKAKKQIHKWLATDYYQKGKEWAYKNVPRKITIEKYMAEPSKDILSDYKFFCFNGKVKFIQVDMDRGVHNYRCYYSVDWIKENFTTHMNTYYQGDVTKPTNLREMLRIAEKLAQGIPFVRVDLYSIQSRTYFGEMTFYPTNGLKLYTPKEVNIEIGNMFSLPEKMLN